MLEQIGHVITRIFGISGGLGLIGLAIMWFGVVPLVACIFGEITSWMLFGMLVLMVVVIALIIKFVIK